MTTSRRVVGTSRGKPVTDADIELMAAEAEEGYSGATLRVREAPPRMGSGRANLDPGKSANTPGEFAPIREDDIGNS